MQAQMSGDDEIDFVRRRLRHGDGKKMVFVRDRELLVLGAHTMIARRTAARTDWSLAGVYWPHADPLAVIEDVNVTRAEQRDLRRAIRNFDVRA